VVALTLSPVQDDLDLISGVPDPSLDAHPCCRVLELRQYTLHPGSRDTLAGLFEHHFLDELAATGMHVPGLFADLDDPDRLVWLRGFPDMAARHRALSDFYLTGRVWREHAAAANATMVDSDDVLLLAPLHLGAGYPVPATPPAVVPTSGHLVIDVHPLGRLPTAGVSVEALVDRVLGAAGDEGAEVLLVAATHPAPNDFAGLPVRDERVAVWLIRHPSREARDRVRARLGILPADETVRLGPLNGSQIG
jgi:hypothetical protein